MTKIIWCYFDLPWSPFPGWEFRLSEILEELGHVVFRVPKHLSELEKRISLPSAADIIFVSNPMCIEIGTMIKKEMKLPLVLNFLDIPVEGISEQWRFDVYEKLKPLFMEADYITAISKWTAGKAEEWLNRRVDLINWLGADKDLYYGKSKDLNYALTIPRGLASQKKYQEAVEAAQGIFPLKIIYGEVSDALKSKLIRHCSFGLHTSVFEGFCLPPVEMNFCGKACIVKDLEVIKEVHAGNKGIVLYSEFAELRSWVEKLASDVNLRKELGKYGKKYVTEKELTLDAYGKRLEKFLCSL